MSATDGGELTIVDGLDLPSRYREMYRPGERVVDGNGRQKRLPRFFFEVEEKETAWSTNLAPHFALGEFLRVDIKETERLRSYPRYVPCAVRILASYLERFRELCGAPVYISVNGGYRSPLHGGNRSVGPHSWATAVDIYRIGSTILDDRQAIETFRETALQLGPEVRVFPYGHDREESDDHLHLDIGYLHLVPPEMEDDHRSTEVTRTPPERRDGERRGPGTA